MFLSVAAMANTISIVHMQFLRVSIGFKKQTTTKFCENDREFSQSYFLTQLVFVTVFRSVAAVASTIIMFCMQSLWVSKAAGLGKAKGFGGGQ